MTDYDIAEIRRIIDRNIYETIEDIQIFMSKSSYDDLTRYIDTLALHYLGKSQSWK